MLENRLHRIKSERTKHSVLVLGAAVIDIIIELDQLPQSGEDVTAEHKGTIVGGCAYNVANILRQLNIPHDLLVPVGKGVYGSQIKKRLVADGYKLLVEDSSDDNGWNMSAVERDGERTFITVPGIETRWKKAWFQTVNLPAYDYLYVSGYELEGDSGEVILDALGARNDKFQLIFDPGPRIPFIRQATLRKVLGMGTILHLNRMELQLLTGESELMTAAKRVFEMTHKPVVVTLGADGSLLYTADGGEVLPGRTATVVDTIGAGDAHTGAFLAGLAAGLSPREACLAGNDVAAEVVQQQGGHWRLTHLGS